MNNKNVKYENGNTLKLQDQLKQYDNSNRY